jgi:hypothetical protein
MMLARPRRPRTFRRPWSARALALAALALGIALAQSAAVVDPPSVVLQAQPGARVEGAVRFTNPGGDALPLRLYLSDWTFDDVGNFVFEDVATTHRSASAWLSFQPTALEVAPSASEVVRYDLTVPEGLAPGTYWTVLFAESEPGDPTPGQPSAAISVRVGHIVYVQVPPLTIDGAILGIFGAPPTADVPRYRMLVQYANTGDGAQGVEGQLSVRDARGEPVIEAAIDRQVVLPESTRVFQIDLVGPLPAGDYTALVVLDYGDDELEVAGTHDFTLREDLPALGGE